MDLLDFTNVSSKCHWMWVTN